MKHIARLFFVTLPAVLVFAVISFICASVEVGAMFAAGVFGLGVQCTQARPERGEH